MLLIFVARSVSFVEQASKISKFVAWIKACINKCNNYRYYEKIGFLTHLFSKANRPHTSMYTYVISDVPRMERWSWKRRWRNMTILYAVKRISCVGFLARNSYEINNSQVGGISTGTLTNKCIGRNFYHNTSIFEGSRHIFLSLSLSLSSKQASKRRSRLDDHKTNTTTTPRTWWLYNIPYTINADLQLPRTIDLSRSTPTQALP